jgi:hypothetical protein
MRWMLLELRPLAVAILRMLQSVELSGFSCVDAQGIHAVVDGDRVLEPREAGKEPNSL